MPELQRQVLPILDPQHVGVTTFDGEDPDTSFPPIEPLRPPEGASNVFVHGDEQKRQALASEQALVDGKRFEQPIATEIVPAGPFYAAEDYHQDYYQTNPVRYKFYRWNCGRDQRLAELWGEAPTH